MHFSSDSIAFNTIPELNLNLNYSLFWDFVLLLGEHFYDRLNNIFITEGLIKEGVDLILFETIALLFAHKTT